MWGNLARMVESPFWGAPIRHGRPWETTQAACGRWGQCDGVLSVFAQVGCCSVRPAAYPRCTRALLALTMEHAR